MHIAYSTPHVPARMATKDRARALRRLAARLRREAHRVLRTDPELALDMDSDADSMDRLARRICR